MNKNRIRIKRFISLLRTLIFKHYYSINIGKDTRFLGAIDIETQGNLTIGSNCVISPWVVFREWGGYIKIGNNCSINSFCSISGNGGVEIGDNVRIASHTAIVSANHNFNDCSTPIVFQGETPKKTIIDDDCWLGAGVRIMAGVLVGRGSVIGAGAVVTHNIPPFSVAVGVPAKVIKNRMASNK
jgi:acetyltransferase-like isoleucine patch superfamily enzyme